MTDIIQKTFEGASIRIHIDACGDPWFVASDVCAALGIGNHRQALSRLDKAEKGDVILSDAIGREQSNKSVSESGMYSLVMSSRKPEARPFQKWVTGEVIPSIRKTGGYGLTSGPDMTDPDVLMPMLLEQMARRKEEKAKLLAAETKIAADAPKLDFADRVLDSKDTLLFREAAKLIREATCAKENEVRTLMFRRKWIQRLGGRNAPAHIGQARGYVTSIEREFYDGDGRLRVKPELRITQKGLARAIKLFLDEVAA